MVCLKKIDISDLHQHIDIGFSGDDELAKYYDKSIKVDSSKEMVDNTFEKIKEYPSQFENCNSYKVELDGDSIGYVFTTKKPNLLVSFSISEKHRNSETLKKYFDCIKSELDYSFNCYLFNRNSRAIDWLEKCGMRKEVVNDSITKLKL
jgi:hypothetical protein